VHYDRGALRARDPDLVAVKIISRRYRPVQDQGAFRALRDGQLEDFVSTRRTLRMCRCGRTDEQKEAEDCLQTSISHDSP